MQVAIYARVSTPRQSQAQTIDQQLDRLSAHVQSQGWELCSDHIFRDDGYSGATLRRPGLDGLRDLVAGGILERILITAPDRLARNYVHQVLLIEELQRFGAVVEFLDRAMSQDPHDQLLLQIRGAVAEYERTLIAERMRRGRLRKLQAGLLLPWTRVPYGYRVSLDRPRDPAGVWIDPVEGPVIQQLFAQYLEEGSTLLAVVKSFQQQGIRSPRGNPWWNASTLRWLLSNPVYTGQVYIGRTWERPAQGRRSPLEPLGSQGMTLQMTPPAQWTLIATIPPLVSQEQFERVQEKLKESRQRARRNNKKQEYLLRALVSCGVCGYACMGRREPPGYVYYKCAGKRKGAPGERCPARFIPTQQLDELVWHDLCEVLTHPESIRQALVRAQAGQWVPQELQARREQVRQGRLQLEQQRERLTDAYQSGVLPLAEYQRRRQAVEQQMGVLDRQAQQIASQVEQQQELAGVMVSIEAFCQRVQAGLENATFAQKRQLVELLIDRVIVTNGDVEIRYVIPTSPSSEHVHFSHLRTNYLSLFPSLAAGWLLGTYPHPSARAGAPSRGTRNEPQCRHPRQPVGQNHRKRGPSGYDSGKKLKGRKRHILVDTQGFVLQLVVHPADLADRDGGKLVLLKLQPWEERFPRLSHLWLDTAYQGKFEDWVKATFGWSVEVVKHWWTGVRYVWVRPGVKVPEVPRGFVPLKWRWIVERTFGWLGRQRRLSKDYEGLPETSEAWIYLAMSRLMLKRLARAEVEPPFRYRHPA